MPSALLLLAVIATQAQAPSIPPDTVPSTAGELRIQRLATLEYPWGLALLPDGRLLITEKPGRLRIWAEGRLSEPVQGVPHVVYRGTKHEQGGMLDVAVDPEFARNHYIYLSFSEMAAQQPKGASETGDPRFGNGIDTTDNILRGGAVARGRLDGNELRDVQIIWRQEPKTIGRGHFGHRLVFAPDGKLFVTSGDRMRFDPAQSLASNLGKVVRINSDGSIPADNPFAGRDSARGDVWSYGHRNMLAAAIDSTGQLWVIEMGPLGGDELNKVEAGRNYGWPLVSDGDNYDKSPILDHATRKDLTPAVRTWTPVIAPSGALFYSGTLLPSWRGSLITGGLVTKGLVRLSVNGAKVNTEERIPLGRRIRDVLQTSDGALLAIVDDQKGDLLRIAPAVGKREASH